MSMTHGTNGTKQNEDAAPPPPRPASSHGSTSSSGSSKHVKCIGRYVITGSLGKGNFARVESAIHTLTRAKVAIKIIETDKIKEDYVRKNLLREAQLMRRLRHPNIIRLYETMKTNNLYCLVTEIAEGGELLSHVRNDFKEKRLSEATARPFIRQLVSALYHLHSVGIVHRDLKMENILLDKRKRQVKIVDFGLSNAAKPGSLLQTHCGSPEYAAPELFIPGREYGPEVDVWSLGVNMYAMLVGKLPFRSPRQGTKRRQKLLEQISGGLTEGHDKEMDHVSKLAKDLVHRLLQTDPRRRTGLDEVMMHPWITKEGTQPLLPFKYVPPDPNTVLKVVDLMSTILEVNPTDIKETVRRDRCDWLAAIYNLLIDQPEGRNIIQRLLMDDPEEQLVDAAHYQGSMEHLRLSQGDNLDSYPPDVATMLYNATAHIRRTGGYRGSLSQPQAQSESGDYPSSTLPLTKREKHRHASQEPHPLGGPRTLGPMHPPHGHVLRRASIASPISSPEHQPHPHFQQPLPMQQAPHHPLQQSMQQQVPMETYHQQPHPHHHHHYHHHGSGRHGHAHKGKRVLPMTPNEEPYQHPPPESMRPHSRAESAPDPLPIPWRPNFAPPNQLAPHPGGPGGAGPGPAHSPTSPIRGYASSPMEELNRMHGPSPLPMPQPPHLHPHHHPHHPHHHKSASKKKLSPLRPKSVSMDTSSALAGRLSKSIDGLNLRPSLIEQPGSHTVSGFSWHQHHQQKKVGPLRSKRNSEGTLQGWSSAQRLGQPADIQAFMRSGQGMPSVSFNTIPSHKLDLSSPISVEAGGSTTSVEIHHELFAPSPSTGTSPVGSKGSSPLGPSPQASNTQFRAPTDHVKPDLMTGREAGPQKQPQQPQQQQQQRRNPLHPHHAKLRSVSAKPSKKRAGDLLHTSPEHSTSMDYVGAEPRLQRRHTYQQDLPNLEKPPSRQGIGGFIGKAFRGRSSSLKEKSASMTLPTKPAV